MSKPQTYFSKYKVVIAGVLIVALTVVGIAVAASTILTNPPDENVKVDPADDPTPSVSPTSEPTQTVVSATEIHLSSNASTPYYKSDFLQITAQLNQPVAGVTVELLNFGTPVLVNNVPVTAVTDTNGIAVFVRHPQNPTDYSVKATIP